MKVRWRAWALALHRDVGYFFTGVVVLYCVSGLAVNHVDDWNPSYVVEQREVTLDLPPVAEDLTPDLVRASLDAVGEGERYRSHSRVSSERVKIYLTDGDMMVDLPSGLAQHETIRRRPVFYYLNRLHVNPARWWKLFSDVFAVSLLLVALTGLLVARGKYGFTGRGKWLVGSGLVFPLVAMFWA